MKVAVNSSPAPSLRRQAGPPDVHNRRQCSTSASQPKRRSASAFFLLPASFSGWRLHLTILAGVIVLTTGTRVALYDRHEQELRTLARRATYLQFLEAEILLLVGRHG